MNSTGKMLEKEMRLERNPKLLKAKHYIIDIRTNNDVKSTDQHHIILPGSSVHLLLL